VKRRFLFLILFWGLGGCATFVTPPEVRLQQIMPVGIDATGVDIEVSLLVTNPNGFDLALQGYSYTLQVAGLPLGYGSTRQSTTFPEKKETLVRIPARLRHADLLELTKRQTDPNFIPYRLIAGLQLDTPLGESSIPLDHQGQLSIPAKYRPDAVMQRLKGLFGAP